MWWTCKFNWEIENTQNEKNGNQSSTTLLQHQWKKWKKETKMQSNSNRIYGHINDADNRLMKKKKLFHSFLNDVVFVVS